MSITLHPSTVVQVGAGFSPQDMVRVARSLDGNPEGTRRATYAEAVIFLSREIANVRANLEAIFGGEIPMTSIAESVRLAPLSKSD